MLSTRRNRLDPSVIKRETLDRLVAAFSQPGHAILIDKEGRRTELPEPLYQHLLRIVDLMREGRAVVMIPEDETFTTQTAESHLFRPIFYPRTGFWKKVSSDFRICGLSQKLRMGTSLILGSTPPG